MTPRREQREGDSATGQKMPALSAPFSGPALYAQKKARKLTTAVYLVTGSVPEDEPIRREVRDRTLVLLSDVALLSQLDRDRRAHIEKINAGAANISGLLEVLAQTGYVAGESAELLHHEFEALARFIAERQHTLRPEQALSDIELDVPFNEQENVRLNQKDSKRHEKGQKEIVSDTVKKTPNKKTPTTERKGEREQTIISLVQRVGKVNVRDVAEVITDCSEKTLQRELLRLVERGTLVKEGERRWSVYRLP